MIADKSSLGLTGLAFIPLLLGMIFGLFTQKVFVRIIRDRTILGGGKPTPEIRLLVGMAGAALSPIGLLWFSLTSFRKITFVMPMIGMFIFGIGVSANFRGESANTQALYVFISVFGFLVATYSKFAASAMAGNTFVRCMFAAGFPLFANAVCTLGRIDTADDQMYSGLGPIKATGVLVAATGAMAWVP